MCHLLYVNHLNKPVFFKDKWDVLIKIKISPHHQSSSGNLPHFPLLEQKRISHHSQHPGRGQIRV